MKQNIKDNIIGWIVVVVVLFIIVYLISMLLDALVLDSKWGANLKQYLTPSIIVIVITGDVLYNSVVKKIKETENRILNEIRNKSK